MTLRQTFSGQKSERNYSARTLCVKMQKLTAGTPTAARNRHVVSFPMCDREIDNRWCAVHTGRRRRGLKAISYRFQVDCFGVLSAPHLCLFTNMSPSILYNNCVLTKFIWENAKLTVHYECISYIRDVVWVRLRTHKHTTAHIRSHPFSQIAHICACQCVCVLACAFIDDALVWYNFAHYFVQCEPLPHPFNTHGNAPKRHQTHTLVDRGRRPSDRPICMIKHIHQHCKGFLPMLSGLALVQSCMSSWY